MFRFAIRDVLWLMVVVALAIGWWWDSFRIELERRALMDARTRFAEEGELTYDFHDGSGSIRGRRRK